MAGSDQVGKHNHATSPSGSTTAPRDPSAKKAYSRSTWGETHPECRGHSAT